MDKGKFALKKIWPFITTILIPIIVLFDYFVIKTGLSKLLLNTIKEFTFRDFILLLILVLVSGLFRWIFLLNKRINSISGKNIYEILSKNEHLIRIIDELRDKCNKILDYQEKIIKENTELKSKVTEFESGVPNPEIYLILETLANKSDGCLIEEDLYHLHYKRRFEHNEYSDFKIVINELKEREYIRDFEGGARDETILEILGKGLKHLKILKQKFEGPL